jgi:hypothetical protein
VDANNTLFLAPRCFRRGVRAQSQTGHAYGYETENHTECSYLRYGGQNA